MELIEPAPEVEPSRRFELGSSEEQPRLVDLDAVEAVGTEQPLHHVPVEQRERELLVVALDPKAPVEVVVLEFDVMKSKMAAEPGQEVFVSEPQTGTRRRDGRERTREAVVVAAPRAVPIRAVVVVPVVEHAHRYTVVHAGDDELDTSSVALREQGERHVDEVLGVGEGEREPDPLRECDDRAHSRLTHLEAEVRDGRDAGNADEDEGDDHEH